MYDPALSLDAARSLYFARSGFPPDGGYAARWVKIGRGRLPLYLLNTAPRRRAVPYHDLHHVLTGYDTSLGGEAEIGAWELAAGTWPHWIAALLDLAALGIGVFVAPRRSLRAFVRGRSSRTLYTEPLDPALLAARVGEVRARLGLCDPPRGAGLADRLAFAATAAVGLVTLLWLVAIGPFALLFGVLAQRLAPDAR